MKTFATTVIFASVLIGCLPAYQGAAPAPTTPSVDAGLLPTSTTAPTRPTAPTLPTLRIACGQTASIEDADGNVWSADNAYTGGSAQVGTGTISGTTSPSLYEGQRYGDNASAFHYTLAAPAGAYTVTLKFAEGFFTAGQRVFDVSINGSVVLDQFDIYVAAGNAMNTAVDETFAVTSDGTVTIDFQPSVQDPRIDAIELRPSIDVSNQDAGSTDAAPIPGSSDAGTNDAGSNAAKLLSYLTSLDKGTDQRVLSGQHVGIWNGDSVSAAMANVTPLVTQTGKSPSILGVVMNYVGNSGAYSISVANDIANAWWDKGGLIELSIYSDDPTFSANSNGYPNGKSISASAFHQLTDTSSAAYTQWHKQLDTYAAELHTLTDSGNVVLLRPFIELNGNWNWYGAQSPTDFITVWKDMYTYLMKDNGLVNVLWIYNVNASVGGYGDYYPGASYVDIVGMDIYDSADKYVTDANDGGMYSFLVSTGKPLILPEFGLSGNGPDTVDNSQLITMIKASLPHVVGFVDWCDGFSLSQQNGASTLLNDPWIVNLGDMPKDL